MKLGDPIALSASEIAALKRLKTTPDNAPMVAQLSDLINAIRDMDAPVVNVHAKSRTPDVNVAAPVVHVAAPAVTVSPVMPKPVRWKFTHTYDTKNNLVETLAEPA